MIADESKNLTDVCLWHAEFPCKNPFELLENRLASDQPVLGEHELQDVKTEPTGSEGRDQDVGVQQDPHEISSKTS